ncbi:MAG TPA: MBL fold metallo-hydrolase [Flavilitoribacter sp.]|nr:MBL fold metallo-hydrolase [Flavilitoribacter sp.]
MKVTFLGTGTSQGVPVIGCDCEVCLSTDERDKRLRTSALLQSGDHNFVIDCGPDFRQQMLRAGVRTLDAILLTHEHNDHVIGMDDVRPFNFSMGKDMPIYAAQRVEAELKKRFAYVFDSNPYPGAPRLQLRPISKDQRFEIEGVVFQPVEVCHGQLSVLGFRVGDFAYLTDMSGIAEAELQKLSGVRTLVVNALHHKPHYSHFNLEQAIDFIGRVGPGQAYLTHISHRMGKYGEVILPPGIALAYDGLSFEIKED